MPKKKISQPELIREERAEYKITPEEQARKDEYRARLKAFLEDPASRKIEGFPIGEIEDILALSDPPYYTACPNPFLAEIIEEWEKEKQNSPRLSGEGTGVRSKYHREPFATDVSEGKNDPIYNAHSYHTKVPHKAIMRYILHYTEPGDIVFDGFCGTGMTGVAAQLCGDKQAVEGLGYRVTGDGKIFDGDDHISHLGARKAVLNDLSPAATFISYNYNVPFDVFAFNREAKRILDEVEEECGWIYQTKHTVGRTDGKINFVLWSDVYLCPSCGSEMVFWDVAIDKESAKFKDTWDCPSCDVLLAKKRMKGSSALRVERKWVNFFDHELNKTIRKIKQTPVLINYKVGKKRFEKKPDKFDLALIEKIESEDIPYLIPTYPLPKGDKTGDPLSVGLTHSHLFYTRSNLWVLMSLYEKISHIKEPRIKHALLLVLTAIMPNGSRLRRFRTDKKGGGPLSGTLYIASLITPPNLIIAFERNLSAIEEIMKVKGSTSTNSVVITNSSSVSLEIKPNSLDYVFIDPPFGSNLMYSELNFLWEAWLKVFTNNTTEAIVNDSQNKALIDYQYLMEGCFTEFFRILKPGRWMTVEFHNTSNSVWSSIQEALIRAGFIIANVSTFSKEQGSFNQVMSTGSVKQDLIITAYKPNDNLEERFRLEAGTSDGAWDFVRYHLSQLPRVVEKTGEIEVVAERQAFLLFDRMVAFHIQRGASVPLSAGEFYAGLKQKFVERDGMYFLPDQVAEYDAARLRLGKVAQLTFLVSDEKSAIQWLRQQLDPTLGGEPQTFADLQPKFMRGSNQAKHEQMPELGVILEQNFIEDSNGQWRAPDPSKATDLERLRLKALLREFASYVEGKGKLKQFRTEAVRAGFAEAYKKREYKVILDVAGRLPESVLHEDPDLLMYFDTATLRSEE